MIALWCSIVQAAPVPGPKALSPPDGAVEVDPTLDQLRVEFDRPMRQDSWSWTGGPPWFPTGTAQPRFDGPKTAVLPVALEAGRLYVLGLNSPRARGFRSTKGVPARPTLWRFATAGPPMDAEVARAALDRALSLLTHQYSHQDRLGLAWSERLAPLADLPLAGFALGLAEALAEAKDPHLGVRYDGHWLATHRVEAVPNVDPERVDASLSRRLDPHTLVGSVEGVPYLFVTDWMLGHRDLEALDAWLTAHCDGPLIVDVRINPGGDEPTARELAGRFTAEPVPYARQRFRNSDGSYQPMGTRTLAPRGPTCTGPVAVLMGPMNASSNESFLLMMRAVGATLVGETSAGTSGNPGIFPLIDGTLALKVPRWQGFDLDGTPLEGRGVTPDVQVQGPKALDVAVRRLRRD